MKCIRFVPYTSTKCPGTKHVGRYGEENTILTSQFQVLCAVLTVFSNIPDETVRGWITSGIQSKIYFHIVFQGFIVQYKYLIIPDSNVIICCFVGIAWKKSRNRIKITKTTRVKDWPVSAQYHDLFICSLDCLTYSFRKLTTGKHYYSPLIVTTVRQ